MNRTSFLLPLVFIMIFCSSCQHHDNPNEISSGIIQYQISYLNDNLKNKEEDILPRSMELEFNKKQAVNYIDGFLGLYKLNTKTSFDSRKCITMLKVFDRNYLYKGQKGELMCCFDDMEDMLINETDATKVIAGFTCNHATVSLPAVNETFDIYYTRDIDLQYPNMNNPYKDIDGVLMQFELRLLHLRMKFSAESYKPISDRDSELLMPKNPVEVTRDQMTEILNRLLD